MQLEAARQEIMAPLSAASMESYSRAYPHLTRLHMLQELAEAAALPQVPLRSCDLASLSGPGPCGVRTMTQESHITKQ